MIIILRGLDTLWNIYFFLFENLIITFDILLNRFMKENAMKENTVKEKCNILVVKSEKKKYYYIFNPEKFKTLHSFTILKLFETFLFACFYRSVLR